MPAVKSCAARGCGLPYFWGRWLWYGRPKFLRWRLLAGDKPATLFGLVLPGVGERNEPGCGCFVLWKDLAEFLAKAWPGLRRWYRDRVPSARHRRRLQKYWAPRLAAGRRCPRPKPGGCRCAAPAA